MKITSKWQTYRTTGYAYQIAGSDPRSTGGVHHHQIRRTKTGTVIVRILQSNGSFCDASPAEEAMPDQIKAAEAAK